MNTGLKLLSATVYLAPRGDAARREVATARFEHNQRHSAIPRARVKKRKSRVLRTRCVFSYSLFKVYVARERPGGNARV